MNELPQDENLATDEESKDSTADVFTIVIEKFNMSQATTKTCFN